MIKSVAAIGTMIKGGIYQARSEGWGRELEQVIVSAEAINLASQSDTQQIAEFLDGTVQSMHAKHQIEPVKIYQFICDLTLGLMVVTAFKSESDFKAFQQMNQYSLKKI